jgi:transposase
LQMGQALSLALRERIYTLREKGMTLTNISEELSIPHSTVKQLCRRFRQQGISGLVPSYSNCGSKTSLQLNEQKARFIALKEQHLRWGAPRLHLEQQLSDSKRSDADLDLAQNEARSKPEKNLASIRSLNRWYRQVGLSKPRKQGGQVSIGRALAPHNIWEIDAKERLILCDGSPACYLTITDEKSGAWLEAPVFPLFPYQPSTLIGSAKCTYPYF